MKKEIYVCAHGKIKDVLKRKPDRVSFGHEGCALRFLSDVKFYQEIIKYNIGTRIIVPKVNQDTITGVLKVLETIISNKHDLLVTVNDYGLLYALSKMFGESQVQYVLGRMLVKSYSYIPWHNKILKHEEDTNRENEGLVNVAISAYRELYEKYSIKAVEMNLAQYNSSTIKTLEAHNVQRIVHVDDFVLALSRACPSSKLHAERYPECLKFCDDEIEMKYACHPSNSADKYFTNMFLRGNVIYKKNNKSLSLQDSGDDYFTYDSRLFDNQDKML